MLDIQELARHVESVTVRIQERGNYYVKELSAFLQQHEREMAALKKQRDNALRSIQKLESDAADVKQKMEDSIHQKQILETELKRKESEHYSLLGQFKAIQDEVHKIQPVLQSEKNSSENNSHLERRKVWEFRQNQMLATLNKYSSCLGLKFEKSDNVLEFIFINISEQSSEKEFRVVLTLDENASYQVTHSDPALSCLKDLENLLVQTNDLKAFIISIRKAFKSCCKSPKTH